MADLSVKTNKELVNTCINLDKEGKKNKKLLDAYKAELQKRGLNMIEDRNVKYVKFFGQYGSAYICDKLKLDPLNMDKLKDTIGEGLCKDKITETTETKYKFDPNLEKALKAIFMDDYTFEFTLEEFFDEMSIKPDDKQKRLLRRKLKGDYVKDKDVLLSVFGYTNEQDAPDFDVDLWYIYRIKNAELIRVFLPEDCLDQTMEQIKKCIIVETTTSIGLDYKKEMEDEENE